MANPLQSTYGPDKLKLKGWQWGAVAIVGIGGGLYIAKHHAAGAPAGAVDAGGDLAVDYTGMPEAGDAGGTPGVNDLPAVTPGGADYSTPSVDAGGGGYATPLVDTGGGYVPTDDTASTAVGGQQPAALPPVFTVISRTIVRPPRQKCPQGYHWTQNYGCVRNKPPLRGRVTPGTRG